VVIGEFVDDFVGLVVPDVDLAVLVAGCVLTGFFGVRDGKRGAWGCLLGFVKLLEWEFFLHDALQVP
jgi:hypothetical protein